MQDLHDLALILDAGVPLVVIETHEERRALELVTQFAITRDWTVFTWSATAGLRREPPDPDQPHPTGTRKPDGVLAHIQDNPVAGLYVLFDFYPYLADAPLNVRLLREIAQQALPRPLHLILVGSRCELPEELHHLSARFRLRLPDQTALEQLVREEAQAWGAANRGARVRSDRRNLERIVQNLRGLTEQDARRLVRTAIWDDGALTEEDLPKLNKAKFELLNLSGVVHFEFETAPLADLGGLQRLKAWLAERQDAFLSRGAAASLPPPRGILLLGVQGSGKSLAARVIAGIWGVPLLRLDMGTLYNKYYGESERNLREALSLAEHMAPCVLWIDEIEKGLATGGDDGGTSQRMLGTLLTWLAERTAPVFLAATANDIQQLPPELMRKGRVDEIFFVDLPKAPARETIFAIHLRKRRLDPGRFDRAALARLSEGFSGAEIEQAVVSACYGAAAAGRTAGQADVERALASTRPLSVVMAESVQALRDWARDRAVAAD
jgi:SpoVK/Ycf46/Vps4 family AAA+-type ATPase